MARKPGKFITFEGLDGSGKSTQLKLLAKALSKADLRVVTAREPGTTEIGERVRAIILDSRTKGMFPTTELALMFASRTQLVYEVILPALKRGEWVLCDRHTDSSEAYQGGGRQIGSERVLEMHRILCRNIQPDLTLLFWGDMASHVSRAHARNTHASKGGPDENRFEMEDAAFHRRAAKAYETIAWRDSKRVVVVNAKQPIAAVHEEVMEIVCKRFRLK